MLSIAYLVFFLATFPFAITRNRLLGFYYAALYIYSAFAVAGYLYLPGLSESLESYFGNDIGYSALRFIFASMVGFWLINMAIYAKVSQPPPSIKAFHLGTVTPFGTWIFATIILVFLYLFMDNYQALSWYIFQDSDSLSPTVAFFIALYKTSVGILITGYLIIRSPEIRNNLIFNVLFAALLTGFVAASVRLGNRTDPTALMIGLLIYEALVRKLSLRSLAWIGAIVLIGVLGVSAIEYFRYTDGGISGPLLQRIVQNDYYAPAHMLFAAMAFDFIDPIAVLRSNSANALVLFGEPYLQQIVTELFREDVATRSAGYAFYILTEGWIFGGWWGIIYNAIVPSVGLWLWNRLAITDNRFASLLVQMLAAAMLLNVTRGQSSYFIKYLYTFILPNIFLAMILVGLRFRLSETRADPALGHVGSS